MRVSIPYRFNERFICQAIFQAVYLVSIPYRFNERADYSRKNYRSLKFQFLIGSMKAWARTILSRGLIPVSIPYRFNESPTPPDGVDVTPPFQFLIGSMKVLILDEAHDLREGFNSL